MSFTDPILANEELVRASIRSSNFDENDVIPEGWQIKRDGTASFSSINTTGTASGPSASYNALSAKDSFRYLGTELQDTLNTFSKGVAAYWFRVTTSPTVNVNVEQGMIRLTINAKAGRSYRIVTSGGIYTNGANPQFIQTFLRYTIGTNPPDPTLTSSILAQVETYCQGGHVTPFSIERIYIPDQDETLKLVLSFKGTTGSQTFAMYGDWPWPALIVIFDVGPRVPGGLYGFGGSDYTGTPPVLKEFTIQASDSRTFYGNGTRRTDSHINHLVAGDWQNGNGNQRAWFTFSGVDQTKLDDLIGVPLENVEICEVYLYNYEWRQASDDGYISLGYHPVTDFFLYANEPPSGLASRYLPYVIGGGGWLGLKPPVTSVFLDAIRDGTLNGFMVGNSPFGAQYCGVFAGYTDPGYPSGYAPPKLHIRYWK